MERFDWMDNREILDYILRERIESKSTYMDICVGIRNTFGIDLSRDQVSAAFQRYKNLYKSGTFGSNEISKDWLIRENQRLRRKLEQRNAFINDVIEASREMIMRMKVKPVKIPKRIVSKNDMEFHINIADIHYGAEVNPDLVQKIGNYNPEIARKRIGKFFERVIHFKEEDASSHGLNKLVINFLGDILNGEYIYPGQAFFTALPLIDQVYEMSEIMASHILTLAKYFTDIEIFCVAGNHGRVNSRKGEYHPKSNFDTFIYKNIAILLRDQKNVKVFISDSPNMIVKHGNYVFHISHGSNIRTYLGVPYYGIDRRYKRLQELYNLIINYYIQAHFHTSAELDEKKILCASMVGGDPLSINVMDRASRPSQKVFYFHKVHGVNRITNIYLSEVANLSPDKYGIYTSYEVQ